MQAGQLEIWKLAFQWQIFDILSIIGTPTANQVEMA